ncbi:MAG: four helix bundle protein [Desulfobacteraceae bacterium]|nr:MAG: four helix bundle protein [Desulfobacteraceae bacterium]
MDPPDQKGETKLHRRRRLRPSGGYRRLRSFQTATLIYDGTVSFCGRFIDSRSRTHDQMVQAARSGRQNIAGGSRAGATSSKSETHLTNVARASLDELLLDFEDFLRQRKLSQWAKGEPEAQAVRKLGRMSDPADRADPSDSSDTADQMRWARYAPWLEHKDPEVVANTLICLIHQANYLLDQQIAALERAIIEDGGYREQLTAARLAERGQRGKKPPDPSDRTEPTDRIEIPSCPLCGQPMKQRTARQGKHPGSRFWGCTRYPDCKGTRPDPADPSDRLHGKG